VSNKKVEPLIPSRLVVVETAYYQPINESPLAVESRYSRELETDEQLYQRFKVATEKWEALDKGWIGSHPGLLLIQNTEGQNLQLKPTKEEKKELSQHVLELSLENNPTMAWLIPPGESMRAYPSDISSLLIRCQKGTAKYTLTLFPG